MRRAFAYLCFLLCFASTKPSSAQSPAAANGPIYVEFDFFADPSCPTEAQVFSLVHRRSERVVRTDSTRAAQHLQMRITRTSSGFEGSLRVEREDLTHEERKMQGGNCEEVVAALALTAALSIDPHATLSLGPVEEQTPQEAPAGSDDTSAELETDSAKEERPVVRFSLGPLFSAQKLMSNVFHLGGGLVFSLSRPNRRVFFPLEMHASIVGLWEAQRASSPSISTQFALAQLNYCVLRFGGAKPFSVSLCPLSQLGVVVAHAHGFSGDNERSTRFWASLGAELWMRLLLHRHLELSLGPSFVVPLTDREFAVNPGPEILTSSLNVGASLSLGLSWRF